MLSIKKISIKFIDSYVNSKDFPFHAGTMTREYPDSPDYQSLARMELVTASHYINDLKVDTLSVEYYE